MRMASTTSGSPEATSFADPGEPGVPGPPSFEGMTWAPGLPTGERVLLLISDNDFRETLPMQFLALAVPPEADWPDLMPTKTTLRSPTNNDQNALIWFMEKAYRQTYFSLMSDTARSAFPDGTWLRDWPRVLYREPGTISVLAERSGQIIGFAQTVVARNGEMGTVPSVRHRELRFLYVDASQYGNGLAHCLLQTVLDDDEPAELWVVESNSRAISFYCKNGFAADGARFALGEAESSAEGVFEIRMVR